MFRNVINFLLYTVDHKTQPQTFFYRQQSKLVTKEGVCLSLIFYLAVIIIFLGFFARDLFVRDKPTVTQLTQMNEPDVQTELLTENFKLKFSILNLNGPDLPADAFTFFIQQLDFDGRKLEYNDVKYSKCDPIIGTSVTYCLDPGQSLKLSGNMHAPAFDVFGIDIHFKNVGPGAQKLIQGDSQLLFVMTFTDQLIDLSDLHDPVKEYRYLYSVFVSPNFSQYIYFDMKRIDMDVESRALQSSMRSSILTLDYVDNHYFFSNDVHNSQTLTSIYFSLTKNRDIYKITFPNSAMIIGHLGGCIFLLNFLFNLVCEFIGKRQLFTYVHSSYKLSDADLNASSHELVRIVENNSFVNNVPVQRLDINNALAHKLASNEIPAEFIHENIQANINNNGPSSLQVEENLNIPSTIDYKEYVKHISGILDQANIVDMYIHLLIMKEVMFTDSENIYMNNLSSQTVAYLFNKETWRKSRVGGNFPNIKSLIMNAKRRFR
jgi:hypothetical protein